MRDLIAQALENNRDLRQAVLRVRAAQAAYGIQRAEGSPVIDAHAREARSRVPADLNLTGRPVVTAQYEVGVGLASWEIDFWGRVRNLKDAALERYLATEEARRAATVELIAQVAHRYLVLREFDERIALARHTVSSRMESLRIFTRRVEVGSTSRLDLAQVRTLTNQAQTLLAQLEQAHAAQSHALQLLVGRPVDLAFRAEGFEDPLLMGAVEAGLPSTLLERRPDILAAEHALRAAHADIGAARAAFFPRVALTGSLGTASAELDGLFAAGSRAWTFSPAVSMPLFDAGRLRHNLTLAEVRREQALADYDRAVQGAFRDVSDALSARRWLTEQVAFAQAARSVQTERARLAQLRYDSGAAAYLEVLEAQRDLLSAEQQLVQLRRALLSSRVNLYAALGGGAPSLTIEPSP